MPLPCPQALDWERLGPERKPYSESRRRRLAVQEAATALVATLQVLRRCRGLLT